MSASQFDLVVVGSGPGGGACARDCAQHGMSVAIIEDQEFGGVCPNRGCNPKKILIDAAEAVQRIRDQQGNGVQGEAFISWPELIRFKRSFTDNLSDRINNSLVKSGIKTFHGRCHFIDHETIIVGDQKLKGRFFLLAPGSYPRPLNIQGEELVTTSDQFLELDNLPPRIVFLGGGFISFEFSHLATVAGSQTTILHRSKRPLKHFDSDMVKMLLQASKHLGVDIKLNTTVKSIRRDNGALRVETDKESLQADLVVHGAGRIPDLRDLNTEAAGVTTGKKGIEVNKYMQNPGNPRVYAAGDAAETPYALTPSGDMEGKIAAKNIRHGNIRQISHNGIPSAVFTIPPLASVGFTEEQAKHADISYKVRLNDTSNSFSSKKIGQKFSGYKMLFDEQNQHILGAHIFGHNAEELINVFGLAIRNNLTTQQLAETIWVYPTYLYDIKHMLG